MRKINIVITIALPFFISNCATYTPQYKNPQAPIANTAQKEIAKTFYLIGGAGHATTAQGPNMLGAIKKIAEEKSTKNDYALLLGNSFYYGLPKKKNKLGPKAETIVNKQLSALKNFKGKTYLVPGKMEWQGSVDGLERIEDYLKKALDSDKVLEPDNGCPLEVINMGDNIALIMADTQWYLEDWGDHPKMNDKCEIKTRGKFLLEIEGELKKNKEKTIIFATHHPLLTNGKPGGQFPIKNHLLPLPVVGTLIAQIRSNGAIKKGDRYNQRYDQLMRRLEVMAKDHRKLVFVSGHDRSLQYIEGENVKQIISGAASKADAAALGQFGQFSYGGVGMAKLDVHKDGSSVVTFLKAGENGNTVELFKKEIIRADKPYNVPNLPSSYPATVTASVYNDSLTQRTKFFKTLWGKHYREVYGTGVRAKVALLDTLYGGLKVVRAGGGHQTRSLRLVSAKGKTYNMRALKKSAVQFIQTVVIKNNIVEDGFTNTLPEDLILDFYTAAHPYGAFSIPKLASAAQVFHTNPKLYFVPKQAALGKFNGAYGDALYMIVERPDENYDGTLFNYADDVESTDNMLDKLRSDEDNVLDEKAYIRARLFDMLIGDWDRHSDQWRFAEYKDQSGKDVFVPIPRDRDQVFANFDGSLLNAVRALFNVARQFQVYGATLKHTAWFNTAGIKLDRAFIENYGREEWAAQANFIKKNVTDAVIEAAFKDLPKETQDSTAESIKQKLKGRRDNIVKIAEEYYDYFSNLQTVTGTDKDDHFEITRMPNGKTEIKVFRIKDGKKGERYINRVYNSKDTREIWVYGLDNDDVFEVKGKGDNPIKLRLIGGQNNDVYRIANGQKVTVYDQRAANNTVEKKSSAAFRFTNNYDFNTYDYLKEQKTTSAVLPSLGYNPDDGFLVGFSAMFTTFGFQRNPFKSQHRFSGGYYFATSSYNINYEGEFANIFGDFNFIVGGGFRSPSFSENFFGFGNGTENPQNLQPDRFGLDYNRTRIGKYSAKVGLKRDPGYGSTFRYHLNFEAFEVENTPNRFISLFPELMLGQTQFFGTVAANYTYESYDNRINPSRGMHFALATGATQNLKDSDRVFGFVKPQLGFYNAITNNKKLVLKTAVLGHFNIGNHYEFYQGAQLGRDHGLRGFRRQRFNGRSAAAASADIRYSFNSFKTGLAPVQIGIFGGYDVGRVWVANDTSNLWHTSYGGGFWVNLSDLVSGTLNTFASKEGLQIAFRIAVSM